MPQIITTNKLAEMVKQDLHDRTPVVIAISGFGGSGKSTAADRIATLLGDAAVIGVDQFITERLSGRSADWSDIDWQRLKLQVLDPIAQGVKSIDYQVYDWMEQKLGATKHVDIQRYAILEGIGLLRPELNPYFDYKLWIDVDIETAVQRGKQRDAQNGAVHDVMWDQVWRLNDLDYFEKYHPEQMADFLLETLN